VIFIGWLNSYTIPVHAAMQYVMITTVHNHPVFRNNKGYYLITPYGELFYEHLEFIEGIIELFP
jgi:predicted transcriptional regulator